MMELDLELDVIENEPTVLEYARFHGLCCDFTQELAQCYSSISLSDVTTDLDPCDFKDAPAFANPDGQLIKERLAVSKETAMLLKSVHSLAEVPPDLLPISDGRKRILDHKTEVPILRTDNELDMLAFGRVVEPNFIDLKVPLEPIDEDGDEGLEWPSYYFAYPAQCNERMINDKLGVTRAVLLYLQDAIKDSHTLEDSESIREEALLYRKYAAVRPVTPPLLPLTPPSKPYVPSSPGNHLEPFSDDSNSITVEAKALEEQIMSADTLVRQNSDGSDQMLLDMLDHSEYDLPLEDVNLLPKKRKSSDMKIEGPLTPLVFSDSPAKRLKTVAFAEMLVEYIPDLTSRYNDEKGNDLPYQDSHDEETELPSAFENGNDILSAEDDYAFFRDGIKAVAEDANWKVENEKLSEADTARRMPVPRVDFRLPTAPWDDFACSTTFDTSETETDAQAHFLLWVKRNHLRTAAIWHGVSELERTLPLAPFAHEAAKISIEEKPHGEDVLIKMLADITMGDIATSSTGVWKRDGLRLFEDQGQQENMLSPAEMDKGIASLPSKRQLEMQMIQGDEINVSRTNSSALTTVTGKMVPQVGAIESEYWKSQSPVPLTIASCSLTNLRPKSPKSQSTRNKSNCIQAQERDTGLMFGGRFSASCALNNFMALHGMTAKPNVRAKDAPQAKQPLKQPLPPPSYPFKQACNNINELSKESVQPVKYTARKPLDLPPLPEVMPPCSFVIASGLLQRRSLAKQIEKHYSDAEFVSRDFDSQHAANNEADLVISPSTGLMLTTLQQLKQRALPGQPDHAPVKKRMIALHDMYERLIILISEGLSQEREEQAFAQCLDYRDQEAIKEYEKIATQLDGDIIIRYVPGGEHHLARTIVSEMAQFGLPHGSEDIGDIKLLPDQTTWEVFLRRAGLNAFAAQVILALLKDPVGWPQFSYRTSDGTSSVTQTCGLQTFLLMSASNRLRSFQTILGGSRILNKVSALLDEPWLSAAHGFAFDRR